MYYVLGICFRKIEQQPSNTVYDRDSSDINFVQLTDHIIGSKTVLIGR